MWSKIKLYKEVNNFKYVDDISMCVKIDNRCNVTHLRQLARKNKLKLQ